MFNKKITQKYVGFDDRLLVFVGAVVLAAFIPVLFFGVTLEEFMNDFGHIWLKSFMFSLPQWIVNRTILIEFRKRIPGLERSLKRIIWTVLTALIVSTLVCVVIAHSIERLFYLFIDSDPVEPGMLQSFLATYFIILLAFAVYEAIYYYVLLKESIEEKEAVKRERIKAELQSLRNQVNPHFLFNSMNTLMNIIPQDSDLAVRFLGRLSNVYRHVLDKKNRDLLPLEEELDFVDSYLFLQKERFRDGLNVEMDIPDDWHAHLIVPLCIQMLIENAIKHNVISKSAPLTLQLYIEPNGPSLVVRNNLQKKMQEFESTQVGLENIGKRYEILTQRPVEVEDGPEHYTVSVPLVDPKRK